MRNNLGSLPYKVTDKVDYFSLRLLLGDQLDAQHSWFSEVREDVLYVLMEIKSEQEYVKHHRQKTMAFFQAMRSFANERANEGHHFLYLRLDQDENRQSFASNVYEIIRKYKIQTIEYQAPDEYRLDQILQDVAKHAPVPMHQVPSEHFLTTRQEVADLFRGRKQWLMETFYRKMRVKYNLLMEPDGQPVGGKWNYDHENRRGPDAGLHPPALPQFENDYTEVRATLAAAQPDTFGRDADPLWPVTRAQALELLEHFARHALPAFGTYQDTLSKQHPFLYHSLLSFALNVKLLRPLEVVQRCIAEWQARPAEISLAQIEGFVRQIIGWREYMRGIYWAHMPGYADTNHLNAQRPLPGWYWTGETRMACLSHTIGNSLDHAYAHHIQRLMVTGNFATLAGLHPTEVNAWYLGIYADAIEWVQLPNTHGMALFADGGIIATKPYISSGAYVNRMSDYCKGCAYDVKQRHGPRACPFNSLYWHFLHRHRDTFGRNVRMAQAYHTWDKFSPAEQAATLAQAEENLARLESL